LKTGASIVSSSSSKVISTTPLFFSVGAGGGEALTVAKGIAAIGGWRSRGRSGLGGRWNRWGLGGRWGRGC